ncbi:hypothetical protein Q7C_1926 [Methylophaga frappieri]|uniref:Uncharacterized protein n=1 Tax=Methylophaga frappieri (strain ATCC BAA-2434 / DSM 25690 / JAM7) TaxID=754477 RepID=I1YJH4_METFJ|nr:hypothetical protein Q7C_1926 [Methylophaga frappieri]
MFYFNNLSGLLGFCLTCFVLFWCVASALLDHFGACSL